NHDAALAGTFVAAQVNATVFLAELVGELVVGVGADFGTRSYLKSAVRAGRVEYEESDPWVFLQVFELLAGGVEGDAHKAIVAIQKPEGGDLREAAGSIGSQHRYGSCEQIFMRFGESNHYVCSFRGGIWELVSSKQE